MGKKYKIVDGRCVALRSFCDVKEGSVGGKIDSEDNLSQQGDAWVYEHARVHGNAEVSGNARVYGNAEVYGDARVYGDAEVCGNARVYGDTEVYGHAMVYGNAEVGGNAKVFENAEVYRYALVYGNAVVYGHSRVRGDAEVCGNARVHGDAEVYENAKVYGNAGVCGDAMVYGDAEVGGNVILQGMMWCRYGVVKDCSVRSLVRAYFGVLPVNGCYVFYKRVDKAHDGTFTSVYAPSFVYRTGEWTTEPAPDPDPLIGCAPGLHVSDAIYQFHGDTRIAVAVRESDIICVSEGKVRCKACFVMGEVDE